VAATLPPEQAEAKLAMLRKAQRLDPDGKDAKIIESQIALTEAKLLIKDHRPDRFLLERAVELDPTNQEAKDLLGSFEEKAIEVKTNDTRRFVGAGGIFAGMLASVLAIGFWGRKKRRADPRAAKSAAPVKDAAKPLEEPAKPVTDDANAKREAGPSGE